MRERQHLGNLSLFKANSLKLATMLTLYSLISVVNATCTINPPAWTKTQNLITQGQTATLVVADGANPFTSNCPLIVFSVTAAYEDGKKPSADFVKLSPGATVSGVSIIMKPADATEASTPMAVYVQAVDISTKTSASYCFMYRATASTTNFCCPLDYDRVGCLSCSQTKFNP